MIEFHEIASGVWLFPSTGDGHNSAAILTDRAALLVDPGGDALDRRAVGRFLEENAPGIGVRAVAFTGADGVRGEWPDAHILRPGEPQNGVSLPDLVPGWVSLALGEGAGGQLGLYNAALKLLFCGRMLTDPQVAIPRLLGSSQGYLDALTQTEGLDVKLAVPRRGSPATGKREVRARIEGDRSYVYSLLRHLLTTQAAGVSLERALQVASEVYSSFPYLQDHLANMREMWDEIAS